MPNIRNAAQILEAITDHLPELPLPPVANAMIMPVNPQRWGSYIGGSILTQNLESGSADLISRPFENLRVAQAYIFDGHNATHVAKRAAQVAKDTAKINLMAESKPLIGPALAGAEANECAARYSRTMVRDYRLADCMKQKALRARWLKRHAKRSPFQKRSRGSFWRRREGWKHRWSNGRASSAPPNPGNSSIIPMDGNSNSTRRIFSKKFRGGSGISKNHKRSFVGIIWRKIYFFIRNYRIQIFISILIIGMLIYFLKKKSRFSNTKNSG